MDYIAKTLHGLEEVLATELELLGAEDVQKLTRAVAFSGDKALLYRANLELRTALRILLPLYEFECHNERDLYEGIHGFDWHEYLTFRQTLAVDAFSSSPNFTHTQYVSLKTKDAIVDQLRLHNRGKRPDIDLRNPDLRVNVHIRNTTCSVALDSSAYSLHKRGYRIQTVKAPMNELLAAGILLLSGWPEKDSFFDPMCGSGTLPIEAAMIAANRPAQLQTNRFGFMRWQDFDSGLWEQILADAKARIRPIDRPIAGADSSTESLGIAKINVEKAGFSREIQLHRRDFRDAAPPDPPGLVVMNPPYDERLPLEASSRFYKGIGDTFKRSYAGYEAWMISANLDALKHVGLRPSRKITLYNGPLECRLLKYDLYAGSKKAKYQSS